MKNRIGKSTAAKVTEFTVKIRIKAERLEWFSLMSDRLGLTRDQAVSAMLEGNMEANKNGMCIDHVQGLVVRSAAALFPERKTLRILAEAFEAVETGEQKIAEATGLALIELSNIAPKEMGYPALYQTKAALIRKKAEKAVAS